MYKLRKYQQDAVDSLFEYFENNTGNPILVLPTASGKSVIQGAFIKKVFEYSPDTKIMCLTHVKELLEQNAEKIRSMVPNISLGIYSAGLKSKSTDENIIIAGIQSVYNKAHLFGKVDIIMVDECHLISPKATTRYQQFLNNIKTLNKKNKVIGMSATPYRLGSGLLVDNKGSIFTDIAYDADLTELMNLGYLCPLKTISTKNQANTDNIKKRCGDYIMKDLSATMDNSELTNAALNEVFKYCEGRKSWLIFCTSIEHTIHVRDEIKKRGITCEAVTGKTKNKERENILKRFKNGSITAVTNANVWTTGMDAPNVDLIVVLRPTMSPGLYVQMLGRGMRIHCGKKDCLVLDFTDNILKHGPVDKIKIRKKLDDINEVSMAPQKKCPECNNLNFISARECIECNYVFTVEISKLKHDTKPINAPIMSGKKDDLLKWYKVKYITKNIHKKTGKPDSLKITYYIYDNDEEPSILNVFSASVWLCFDHIGYAQYKARDWWSKYIGGTVPLTVKEAIKHEIKTPDRILVKTPRSGYCEIFDLKYEESASGLKEDINH